MVFEVIIYPFYIRFSTHTELQKLFAIVHRHENGVYRFWKADGTYHESYGLVKGSVSVSQSPRSARSTNIGSLGSPKRRVISTPTKTSNSAAQLAGDLDDTPLRAVQKMRMLTRSRNMGTQLVNGPDEDPFTDSLEPPSKRRVVKGSSVLSLTPIRQSQPIRSGLQRPNRPLLHIKEVCMLAYHIKEPALKLLYGKDAYTIESDQGSLIDPNTQSPFKLTEQHAQYVLYSRQQSLKVILSKNTTRSIKESPDEITGGIILLDFGGSNARDEFIAHIKSMVGVEGIGCADE
jgi:hypothetical protein